jgi:hypothetical protein
MSQPFDPVTVYHGPSLDLDWADLDTVAGYNIVRVTAENAERLGYAATDLGLKVRYFRAHLADAESMSEAAELIATQLAQHLVLVEETAFAGPMWEVALTSPTQN